MKRSNGKSHSGNGRGRTMKSGTSRKPTAESLKQLYEEDLRDLY